MDSSCRLKSSGVISPNTLFKWRRVSITTQASISLCIIPLNRELHKQYQGVAEHCVVWGTAEEFCSCSMLWRCCGACARESKEAEHCGWDQWDKGPRRSRHKCLLMPKGAKWETLSPGISHEKAEASQNSNVAGGSKEMTDMVGPDAWGSETWARCSHRIFSWLSHRSCYLWVVKPL